MPARKAWRPGGAAGTAAPVIWLDGPGIPLVALFNSTFRQDHALDEAEITRPVDDALARCGSGLLPVGYRHRSLNSPVFNCPWARTATRCTR